MARPIRWDNVQVPNTGGALGAFDSGADRISQSISDLRALAQEQTAVNQANYETQKQNNTQNIIDQLNRATSQDALSGVDMNQFGNQVDLASVNQAFSQRGDTLQNREFEQTKFDNLLQQQEITNDLASRRLQLDAQKANQFGFKYEAGQIFRENPNTGKVEPVGTYALPPKSSGTAAGIKLAKDIATSNLIDLSTIKSFGGDATAYGNFLAKRIPELNLGAEEAVKVREKALEFHESYFNDWGPKEQGLFDTQQRYGKQALAQLDNEMEAFQETAAQTLGVRPEVFTYQSDDTLDVSKVKKDREGEFGHLFSGGPSRMGKMYQVVSETLGKAPTGKEFDYFLTKASSQSTYVSESDMADVVRDYKNVISDSESIQKANSVLNLMDNVQSSIANQIKSKEASITRKIRSGKAKDAIPALETAPYDVYGSLEPLRKKLAEFK